MTELKKVLSFKVILLITINSIIGSGLFFLPAIGARYAGPASILAWIIVAIITIYTATCFAELVSMYPKAGGIYEFSKHAYGRFFSFLVGWIAWLVGNITTAMLIVGAIQYLLPYNAPIFVISKIIISLLWVVIFNVMAYRGMKTSAFMLVTFAIITIGIIFMLMIPTIPHLNFSNLSPFFIHNSLFKNLSAIFIAVFFTSQAFFGLESVCFLAEETKKPEKVLPRALLIGVTIIAGLIILLVVTSLSTLHWKAFSLSAAPFADLAQLLMGNWGRDILTIGTYLVIIGAAAGWVVTGPRLILALTRDKLFLPQFKDIHKKYHTPHKAIIFQSIATSMFILMSFSGKGYETLLEMLIPLVLIIMSAAIFAVPVLRNKKPNKKRPFKAPFGYVGPIIILLFNIFLVFLWLTHEAGAFYLLKVGFSFILVGIPIYLLISLYYDPKMLRKVDDMFAYFYLLTENISIPLKVRKEIIRLIGNIKGKTVLEFGCSVGTMTMHLAEEVGPKGKIYAVDISLHDLNITKKRIKQKGHKHIKLLHDPLHSTRVHPKVPVIDIIVSVGMLGYVQHPTKVLKEMNQRLKIGDKICFVDYDNFFGLIPNKRWLTSNEHIQTHFKEAGFKIKIVRKQSLFWQYLYIYGKKKEEVN
ncbi:amino acid permease [Candidatus Woesearchaeota archaeon]|nr:amino acid permease [Candidatus Woesearchaeota archaeon]